MLTNNSLFHIQANWSTMRVSYDLLTLSYTLQAYLYHLILFTWFLRTAYLMLVAMAIGKFHNSADLCYPFPYVPSLEFYCFSTS